MSAQTAPERTYSLSIKGEQHLYVVEAWREMTYEQLCVILSDLTSYKVEYLREALPARFDHLGYAWITAADSFNDGPPRFAIRSSDGGKPGG